MNEWRSNSMKAAERKIAAALEILQNLDLPRAQQNERSALCLLALLNLSPNKKWEQAENLLVGITPIMDWAREHYKKDYKPNTRETVRRQTMHQYVSAGIALCNPDKPHRPVNSPQTIYQIESATLELLRTYGTRAWKGALVKYLSQRQTLTARYAREREFTKIPVTIAPGKKNNVNQQGKIGPTMEAINSYRTFLEDPGAYVNVRMKIIGDPDFLMNPNLNAYAPYNKYYNFNSFTVNPNSSQVFVEVNIRESTDYNDSTGLLDLNSNISFGPLPNGIKFNGIPLWILDVNNTFRQGVFEQELTLNGAQWQLATKDNTNSSQNRNTNNNNTNSPTKTQPSLVESYFGIKAGALSTSNLTPTVPSTNDDQNPISVQSQNNTQSILFTNQGRGP